MLKPLANTPFHSGELEAQARAGVGDVANWAGGFIRDYLPEQHRQFHTSQPFLVVAGGDTEGRTWITIVDGPDEMRRKVRELIRAGADVIKVCTSGGVISPRDDPQHPHFAPDELDVLVAEATAAHRFVMAHAQATEGIKNAVRAGIRSIEHGIYLDDEAIEMMLATGTWLVPTLIAPQGVLDAVDRGLDLPTAVVDKARAVVDVHRDSIRRAIEAGVKVAMGTDSGVTPHGRNLEELDHLHQLGMTPGEVFEASTRVAAELMGVDDDLGTIEPGKRADLVRFDGTALDVTDLRARVLAVHQDGELVSGG